MTPNFPRYMEERTKGLEPGLRLLSKLLFGFIKDAVKGKQLQKIRANNFIFKEGRLERFLDYYFIPLNADSIRDFTAKSKRRINNGNSDESS